MPAIRVRGIYATALTALFDTVVDPSGVIDDRFDRSFPATVPDAVVETTGGRQGVAVHGTPAAVEDVTDSLRTVGRDTFVWDGDLPRGSVHAGEVSETLDGGALVECGAGTGFLPYSNTARHVERGDRLRVQVRDPRPPWRDRRPVLDTDIELRGVHAGLVRGRGTNSGTGGAPDLADIVPADPPDGWGIEWADGAEDADLELLGETVERLGELAAAFDTAFADAPAPADAAPDSYWAGLTTRWVWFGRESRFALDAFRREVVTTMPGHHRIKAATSSASDAVDFLEGVAAEFGWPDPDPDAFPFETVTDGFGPHAGDTVAIGHGKPDGRRIELGPGEVTDRGDEELTVKRELSGGGTYDGLGVEKRAGDVATTTVREGRWWYPTVYRSADGTRRGTYVNVCTPLEIFPREVRYVDLHVDVVRRPGEPPDRVDDDELEEAVAAGRVREDLAEKARSVAAAVERALSD